MSFVLTPKEPPALNAILIPALLVQVNGYTPGVGTHGGVCVSDRAYRVSDTSRTHSCKRTAIGSAISLCPIFTINYRCFILNFKITLNAGDESIITGLQFADDVQCLFTE